MPTSKPTYPIPQAAPEIFPASEEQQLLSDSNELKTNANTTFISGEYSGAIQVYEKALAVCPNYLEYDIAVLHANIAACHIKLAEWKDAVESATRALDALDILDPPTPSTTNEVNKTENESGVEAGIITEVDDTTELYLDALARTGKTLNDVHKIRTKALLRRAKARHSLGGWSSLQSALEDYQALSPTSPHSTPGQQRHILSSLDTTTVKSALRMLPGEIERARGEEMADMMGKLKQLGNGILKPFGLSTDNFKFEKDPGSGGYSMNFEQKPEVKKK